MTHIYVIHENAAWLEPLARALDGEGLPPGWALPRASSRHEPFGRPDRRRITARRRPRRRRRARNPLQAPRFRRRSRVESATARSSRLRLEEASTAYLLLD